MSDGRGTHIDIQESVEKLEALVPQQNKPKNCVSNPDFWQNFKYYY